MNYYYDVLLNFSDKNIYFYEWDSLDNIEYYKKVLLVHVSNEVLNDFLCNYVRVGERFMNLIKDKGNCAIFGSKNGSIALEFNEMGESIYRSNLLLEDDINVSEVLYTVDIMDIDYEIIKEVKYNSNLRVEDKMKLVIKCEINNLYNNKDYMKLEYLFMEWFNKSVSDLNEMYNIMMDALDKKLGCKEKNIFDLIKLSYNKV